MFRGAGKKKPARIEPKFDFVRNNARETLRADPADRNPTTRKSPAQGRAGSKRKAKSGSFRRRIGYWTLVAGIWFILALSGFVAYCAFQLPPIDHVAVPKRPPNITILADDGSLLANRGETGGAAIGLIDLPAYLPQAFIDIEDRRFYSHAGIDPIGVARAFLRDVASGNSVQGGSTLTQQLARNLFLTQERTLTRKVQEAILALLLERRYSKDQLLEFYLNRVYFGSGAYGVEAASQKYFGKSARFVSLPEAALLAGLMKSPSKLAPNRNQAGANVRAEQVLSAMVEQGHITPAQAKMALSTMPHAVGAKTAGSLNYAADYVMDELADVVGDIDEDIVVCTTIDAKLQTEAERALNQELVANGAKYGVRQGAIVAMDLKGEVKALVGGRDYAESQFNRAVAARRQPGSAFKPFVYLAALEKGLTPDTVREDAPINVRGWSPENYSREYFGPVSLTKALSLSLNTVAVRLGLEVGPRTVAEVAHRLGVVSHLDENATISLGTSAVTPIEMTVAYVAFANGGIGVQAHVITKVRTAEGKSIYQRRNASFGRVIQPEHAAMMNAMMQETLLTGTARRAEIPGWQAAGKTGTSQDFRDAWFIGYTNYLVASVWLGNDDDSPTNKVSGGNLPVDIWSRFMKDAHKNVSPSALLSAEVRLSGSSNPILAPPMTLGSRPASVGGRGGAAPNGARPPDG